MRSVLTIFSFLLVGPVFSQSPSELFNSAASFVEHNQLVQADSVFTILCKVFPSSDAYFNRGIIRQAMKNTCGYCADMKISYLVYNDNLAAKNIGTDCLLSSDTTFLNRKFEKVSEHRKTRFLDVYSVYLCDSVAEGVLIDTKFKYPFTDIPKAEKENLHLFITSGFIESHLYGKYFYFKDKKIYRWYRSSQTAYANTESSAEWQKTKKLIFTTLSNRYPILEKSINDLEIEIIVAENGQITQCNISHKSMLDNETNIAIDEFLKEYLPTVITFPENKLGKQPVNVQYLLSLDN